MEKVEKHLGGIPEPTLRRLPKYIDLLKRLQSTNVKYVSSNYIADKLNLDSIQVRKDLAITGIIGKPKLGFDLDELIRSLNHTLNWDNLNDAFLVGIGSLGSAIIGYRAFFRNYPYGLNFPVGNSLHFGYLRCIPLFNGDFTNSIFHCKVER